MRFNINKFELYVTLLFNLIFISYIIFTRTESEKIILNFEYL